MELKQLAQILCLAHTEKAFVFLYVTYTHKQMAVLLFIWQKTTEGHLVKRYDIVDFFGVAYSRLLYKNGSLRKLIDNGLVSEIRNNQKFNAVFYVTNSGQSVVKQYLSMYQ